MNPKTINELSDHIVDTWLQVSPEYVKIDVIKQQCVSHLLSLKNKLECLNHAPPIEKQAMLEIVLTGDTSHPEPPYEKYKDLYDYGDQETHDRDHIGELLTCSYKGYHGEENFLDEVDKLLFQYFLNN